MSAVAKILLGRTLSFHVEPTGPEDTAAYSYREDGAILICEGRITAHGAYSDIVREAPEAEVVDHRPHLLMPGFIDLHLHFPQVQVVASWGEQLLDWLNTYTFPA